MGIFFTDERHEDGRRKPRRWFSFAFFFVAILGLVTAIGLTGISIYNEANPVSRECIIESAEVSNSRSGTGGLATSSTKLIIYTQDCGSVYISRVSDPGYRASWQQMADVVNERQGQKMVLLLGPIQLPTEGDRVEGLGFVE